MRVEVSGVNMKKKLSGIITIIALAVYIGSNYKEEINMFLNDLNIIGTTSAFKEISYNIGEIPEYDGVSEYVIINNNEPFFTDEDINTNVFEEYSKLDSLGRCGAAYANIGKELMPTEERGSIGSVKPSGWQTIKYDIVDGKYLYNRCHLIGFQLTGENANKENLITCTRQMNAGTMLDFENEVADYIKKTNNHVLYRATPIFNNDNLVASGVHLEALSIEDNGKGVKFNVYLYNIQDGIEIDYKTGNSRLINN